MSDAGPMEHQRANHWMGKLKGPESCVHAIKNNSYHQGPTKYFAALAITAVSVVVVTGRWKLELL